MPRVNLPRKLLLPDAAFVCAALTLVYCLFLADGWQQLFRDSDTGWHIRTGEHILNTRSLPFADPYSFTRPGEPWFAWEWGADVLTAGTGSLARVAVLYAFAIACATWLWWQLTWVMGGDFLLGWLFAVPMLSTTSLHWLARPHIFGWLLAMLAIWMAERGRSLVLVALLSVVWTNVHASFFLFPLILTLYAAGEFAGRLLFGGDAPRVSWLVQAAAVASVATLLNPYGWHVHQHVLQYLMNTELIDRIAEFQSFNFHAEGSAQIILTLGLAATGGVLTLMQGKLPRFLVILLFLPLGLRSARGLPLVALLLLPIANGALTQALCQVSALREPLARKVREAFAYSSRLRGFDRKFGGAALLPVGLALVLLIARASGIEARAGFPPSEFPVAAAVEVAKLPKNARILAPDKFGGYLIYRFDGQRKVFFDGRSDFYGSDFMKNYIRLVEVRPNWQDELAKYGFTHALLPNRYSLIPALEREGWTQVYTDEVATLLAR